MKYRSAPNRYPNARFVNPRLIDFICMLSIEQNVQIPHNPNGLGLLKIKIDGVFLHS